MSRSTSASERIRPVAELVALAASVALWWWAETHGLKLMALAILVTGWVGWVLWRGRHGRPVWRDWGFRVDNLPRAVVEHWGLAVAAVGVLALAGAALGTLGTQPVLWVVLLLYPGWALVQQFVLQNLFVDNMRNLGFPRWTLPVAAAAVFGGAHLPDVPLALLAATAGLLLTWLWLRRANIWTISITHAALGTAAFLWVLGRDPVLEFPELARLVT